MNNDDLQKILDAHKKWITNEECGERANLSGANLSGVNLYGANLRWADLSMANLRWADLRGANLSEADLSGANLRWADLSMANLSEADLNGADLRGANLSEADLSGATLWGTRGNNKQVKSIHIFEEYDITYTFERLQIGCENHGISAWWEFDDERILEMDGKKALKFWRKNKELIKQIIEHSPATGKEHD